MSWLHGIITVKEIALVDTSKDVLLLENLNKLFVGENHNIEAPNETISFKLYLQHEKYDLIMALQLIVDPKQEEVFDSVDEIWIMQYIAGALKNKLFPREIVSWVRNTNHSILNQLIRWWFIDHKYHDIDRTPEKKERNMMIWGILEIISDCYTDALIIKNWFMMSHLWILCVRLNKPRINERTNQKLADILELINQAKNQNEHRWAMDDGW